MINHHKVLLSACYKKSRYMPNMWNLKSNLFMQNKFFLSKIVDRIIVHPDKLTAEYFPPAAIRPPRAADNSGSLALPGADPCALR